MPTPSPTEKRRPGKPAAAPSTDPPHWHAWERVVGGNHNEFTGTWKLPRAFPSASHVQRWFSARFSDRPADGAEVRVCQDMNCSVLRAPEWAAQVAERKDRRAELQPLAAQLRADGVGWQEIGRSLDVKPGTVWNWFHPEARAKATAKKKAKAAAAAAAKAGKPDKGRASQTGVVVS